jgi:hypothetical protein
LEIYELFRDLATLVDLQQESLDVIENRIIKAKNYTEKAEVELNEAEEYQKKARAVSADGLCSMSARPLLSRKGDWSLLCSHLAADRVALLTSALPLLVPSLFSPPPPASLLFVVHRSGCVGRDSRAHPAQNGRQRVSGDEGRTQPLLQPRAPSPSRSPPARRLGPRPCFSVAEKTKSSHSHCFIPSATPPIVLSTLHNAPLDASGPSLLFQTGRRVRETG